MDERQRLEVVATELVEEFDVLSPPVPIEIMLRQPRDNMWKEVDVNQLSGSFTNILELYSPRMSLARLLVRHIAKSSWGQERGLDSVLKDEETTQVFARMLVMPREMVHMLSSGARNPTAMSMHFEVPEEDARKRLVELADS